jgi:hypothetical protein
MPTIREYLTDLANRNTSTEADDTCMSNLLTKLGIDGRCTCGIVYIKPYNTAPTDIHTFAKAILKME